MDRENVWLGFLRRMLAKKHLIHSILDIYLNTFLFRFLISFTPKMNREIVTIFLLKKRLCIY